MTLPTLALLSALTSLQAPTQNAALPSASKDPLVKYIVVATADLAVAKRARKAEWSTSSSKFAAEFPPERFDIVAWDEERRIVVDRTTGPLGRIGGRTLIERGILAKGDRTGTLDISDLSREEQQAVRALFASGSEGRLNDRPVEPPSSLGLSTMFAVTLTSGGATRKITVPAMDRRETAMKMELDKRFRSRPSPRSGDPPDKQEAEPSPHDELDFVYLLPSWDRVEATTRAAEAVREVGERMRREAEKAGSDLMRKFGCQSDDSLGEPADVSRMPGDIQYGLREQLSNAWKPLGFGSKEEALAFLKGVDSFRIQTSLLLRQTLRPQDPSTDQPGFDIGYEFQLLPGFHRP